MNKALIVGINEYEGNPLRYCVNDAEAIVEVLHRNHDGTVNMQIKSQLNVKTQGKLLGLIRELFDGNTDIALFYFSGHGYVNSIGGYIVTPDAKANNEGVHMDDIIKIANASKALNRVIILDCCHSGAMADYLDDVGSNISIKEGVTILAASRANQAAVESDGHSVFTNLLLLALQGGAADIRGYITPSSVYAYIDQALGEFGQRPVFKTNVCRSVKLRKVQPQLPRQTLLKIIKYFTTGNAEHKLDPSYEYTNFKGSEHKHFEPYARAENVAVFKDLQKMTSVGLVMPIDAPHMYDAAMESKSCGLTHLGQHYWNLVTEGKDD